MIDNTAKTAESKNIGQSLDIEFDASHSIQDGISLENPTLFQPRTAVPNFLAAITSKIGKVEVATVAVVIAIVAIFQYVLISNGIRSYLWLAFQFNTSFLLTILSLIVICEFTLLIVRFRPDSPLQFIASHPAFREMLSRLMPGIVIAACLGMFMPTFSQVKSSIPILTQYTWDATFIAWDVALHGQAPWRLIQPVLGYPVITALMGQLYHVWFALIHLAPICIAMYVSDKHLKLRFFIGYFLTWSIVGTAFALGLASVGPVFLEPLIGDRYFADQMAYLHAANSVVTNPVIEVQEKLLEWYNAGDYGLGRGITAMPSMHVALAALYALAMWELDKRLGIAFTIYLVLIMLGSVHLAYHYAVDGYVSLALVGVIWFATKPVVRLIIGDDPNPDNKAVAGEPAGGPSVIP